MILQEIRKYCPSVLLKIYGFMLKQEYEKINYSDICEIVRKLAMEAEYLRLKADNLDQKISMLREVMDKLKK